MSVKWKVTIGVVALLAILLSTSWLLFTSQPHDSGVQWEKVKPIWENPDIQSIAGPSKLDIFLDEMEFGSIAFNAPTTINIDDSRQIQLILSLADTVDQLKQLVTKEGEKIGATIEVSDRMEAHLSGHMFRITEITPKIQAVSRSQQTKWKWEIHPNKVGWHRLHLTLSVLLEIDGHNTPRVTKTYSKVIVVKIAATQKVRFFIKKNWQWIWAAILVPIVGWLWRRKIKKADKQS